MNDSWKCPPPLTRLLEQIRQRHEALTALAKPLQDALAAPASDLQGRLEAFGLLPAQAALVAAEARERLVNCPAPTAAQEWAAVVAVLTSHWREPARATPGPCWHVLVGAPGVGKTTVLCKWLAQVVLLAERPARVWRLDGPTANTAEALHVFAEVLGVPLSRSWPTAPFEATPEVHLVDLPGQDWRDAEALEALRRRLATLPQPQIHVVVNAAYEASVMLAQVRAFARWPVTDVICTHLDEELRWGKLWNLILGTKCALGFLSAGQNVPGDFQTASLERLLPVG